MICCRWNDQDYRATRCPDEMFHERYGQYGIEQIYRQALKLGSFVHEDVAVGMISCLVECI